MVLVPSKAIPPVGTSRDLALEVLHDQLGLELSALLRLRVADVVERDGRFLLLVPARDGTVVISSIPSAEPPLAALLATLRGGSRLAPLFQTTSSDLRFSGRPLSVRDASAALERRRRRARWSRLD